MLKGISPLLSPDLLKTIAEMGHGDEIVHDPSITQSGIVGPASDGLWWAEWIVQRPACDAVAITTKGASPSSTDGGKNGG